MALPGAAAGHGLDTAQRLVSDVEDYVTRWGADEQTAIAIRTLGAWLTLNSGPQTRGLADRIAVLPDCNSDAGVHGGVEEVTRAEILAANSIDFARFAATRHSIRQYAAGDVPADTVRRAVAAAQFAPSSCNRQTTRVHVWTEPEAVARVLALQSGNRGFGDRLAGAAVVWTDLRNWTEAAERYNGYVDGGMFAMSLIYALHAEGLGTVPLNWSEEPQQDAALRALADLPESAQIVVLIGFGQLPDRLRVPHSHRRSLDSCLTLNPRLAP
ncbi:nitroreductase [Amaricoccus macauensis]|uniref:Nitroreductase n=1 Tax=Amaricoccus macauensis TaxID=57001 RepID=A0A840STY6_9RHOB|nr:nitroreductase family protein [Amaricoccus macauensis]MBB5224220.1 nitroreductase [Amaricoccus macauensis]